MRLRPILITALLSLTSFFLFSCKNKKDEQAQPETHMTESDSGLKVGYVNMDTVYAHLEYYKELMDQLQQEEAKIGAEMQQIQRSIISAQNNLQVRVRAKDISEDDIIATEKKIAGMSANMQKRQETMAANLMQKQAEMSAEMNNITQAFFVEFNKSRGYDLILANNQVKTVFYAKESMDVTVQVIEEFNAFIQQLKREQIVNKTLMNLDGNKASDTVQQ